MKKIQIDLDADTSYFDAEEIQQTLDEIIDGLKQLREELDRDSQSMSQLMMFKSYSAKVAANN